MVNYVIVLTTDKRDFIIAEVKVASAIIRMCLSLMRYWNILFVKRRHVCIKDGVGSPVQMILRHNLLVTCLFVPCLSHNKLGRCFGQYVFCSIEVKVKKNII